MSFLTRRTIRMNSAHWALQPHLKLAGELKRNKSANSLKAFSRFKMLVSLLLWSEMNSGKFGPVGSPKEFVDQLVSFLHTFSTQHFTVNRKFCLAKPFVGLRLFLRPWVISSMFYFLDITIKRARETIN